MKSRRTIILIAAVVIGGFAALGLYSYVKSAGDSANDAASAVEIWVAKQEIPKGTKGQDAVQQGLIGKDTTAKKYRSPSAITDPETELAGLVAASNIPVNQPLVQGSFASSRVVNAGITERLKDGNLATITFNVDSAKGVAYLIEPDDYVNVLIERKWSTPFFDEEPPVQLTAVARAQLQSNLRDNDATRPILSDIFEVEARYVYQKAQVLAVGADLAPQPGDSISSEEVAQQEDENGLITLAVPPEAVQTILNVGRDNIYLSLVSDDYEPKALLPLDPTTQVLPGELADQLTPYAEGVDVSTLTFSEEDEDLIGDPPTQGSSDESDSTAASTEPSQDSGAEESDQSEEQ